MKMHEKVRRHDMIVGTQWGHAWSGNLDMIPTGYIGQKVDAVEKRPNADVRHYHDGRLLWASLTLALFLAGPLPRRELDCSMACDST